MAPPPLLTLRDVHLTFGGTPLLTGTELSVSEGERLCLVGRNGSGKSTLLKIAAGFVEMDSGDRFFQPGRTIRYLPQEPDLSAYASTLDYVNEGLTEGDDPYRGAYLLEVLGLTGKENPKALSGGEARRAALARTLAPEPDILLLDEPTNHLDLPAIEWLEEELKSLKSAIVLISHDRRFLENLSRATVWIDRGISRRLDKGFGHFEAWRDEVFEQEEIDQQKLAMKIKREEHWMTYGVTARRRRNMRRVRELADLRKQKREHRGPQGTAKLTAAEGETSGKLVIEAKAITKTYEARPIVKEFSTRIQRGDRIGLVGPNGAGKSSLLECLTGALVPEGTIQVRGRALSVLRPRQRARYIAYVPQRSELRAGLSVRDVVMHGRYAHQRGLGGPSRADQEAVDRAIAEMALGDFEHRPYPRLSVGEQQRVMVARAIATEASILLLDEPTAALDVGQTLSALGALTRLAEQGLTLVVVLHALQDVLTYAHRALLLSQGSMVAVGATDEVLTPERVRGVYGVEMTRGPGWRFALASEPSIEAASIAATSTAASSNAVSSTNGESNHRSTVSRSEEGPAHSGGDT